LTDWRLPENRREAFQRSYTFSLNHLNFPGMVYAMLPAIAERFDLDDDGRAWLAWLNGNTQNAVTSMLILEAAPSHHDWLDAVEFWNDNFKALEWDTDRRHQKSKFGAATAAWYRDFGDRPAERWAEAGAGGWQPTWAHAKAHPYFGRLSAWSGMEFARILLGADVVPDMGSWLLEDRSGSRSHRNGLAVVAGYDAWSWEEYEPFERGIVPDLTELADDLLAEAFDRNPGSIYVSRLTMESALCTYKSWHKPNRRYPNVYADMMYLRIKRAEAKMSRELKELWDIRRDTLAPWLRLEDRPDDPGLHPAKQNHYRETGEIPLLHLDFPDMEMSEFDLSVAMGGFGEREDPTW
jgi:hypothetical protein